MSSETFENLEEDLRNVIDDAKRKISVQIPKQFGEERKKIVRDSERLLDDADSLLDEMDLEVPKAPQPYRMQLTAKVRNYRDEIKKIASELKQLKESKTVNFTRQELIAGGGRGSGGATSQDFMTGQRSSLYRGNQILDKTSQSIARSQQVAIETEEIGHGIISEMGDQRESLLRTQSALDGTDANLVQSRKILKSMYMRVMTNKLILVVVILMELVILAGVIYWKFFR